MRARSGRLFRRDKKLALKDVKAVRQMNLQDRPKKTCLGQGK